MTSTKYDLIDLLIEDIKVNFGVEQTIQGVFPRICWSAYILSTVFRGDTTTKIFAYTNMNHFLPFLTKVRVGARMEFGDPLTILFSISSLVLVQCCDTTKFNSQQRTHIREEWTKTLLRCISNIMCHTVVCKFICENDFRLDNTIVALKYMADVIAGKDDLGLDPNSALEGLIFHAIALLEIHSSRISPVTGKKVTDGFQDLFTYSKEKSFLYKQIAIPSAMEEIRKWNIYCNE